MKKALCVCLVLLCLFPALISCAGKRPVRSAEEVAALIETGMSFDEVLSTIGEDGKSCKEVGSGMCIYEWTMRDGKYLLVWFESPRYARSVYDCYAIDVRVTDTPFRGPAQ